MISKYKLSKQEMKILIYRKMKLEGKSYAQSFKEIEQIIKQVNKKKDSVDEKKDFKEEFNKLRNG